MHSRKSSTRQSTASTIINGNAELRGTATTSGPSGMPTIRMDPVGRIDPQTICHAEASRASGQGQSGRELIDGLLSPKASSQFQTSTYEPPGVADAANPVEMIEQAIFFDMQQRDRQVVLENIPERTTIQVCPPEPSEPWMSMDQEIALGIQDQRHQAEFTRSSSIPNSPKEWMQFINSSPVLDSTSLLEHSSNNHPLLTACSPNSVPCPTMTERLPGNDVHQNQLIHGWESADISHLEPPRKRRRMRAGYADGNIDITESVHALQSLHETSATGVRSSAIKMVSRSLENVLAFAAQESVPLIFWFIS